MASYGYTFNSGDGVTPTRLNAARTVSDIVNADIKSDAAIAGTKIAPNFGSQNVVTTGTLSSGAITAPTLTLNTGSNPLLISNALDPYIEVRDTAATTRAFVQASNGIGGVGTISNHPFRINTNSTERLRIDASGNVGIGTSSLDNRFCVAGGQINTVADDSYALALNATTGNLRALPYSATYSGPSLIAYSAGYVGLGNLSLDASTIRLWTGSSERMRIDANGNVGIGTSSPGTKVDIAGNDAQLRVRDDRNSGTPSSVVTVSNGLGVNCSLQTFSAAAIINVTSNHHLEMRTNNTERLRIDANGGVGIGTSSPAVLLHLEKADSSTGLRIANPSSTGATPYLTLAHGGSAAPVTEWNNTSIVEGAASGGLYLGSFNGDIKFYAAAGGRVERMRIDASGNVGIGTSSPAYLLDANGTVNTSDAYRVDGVKVVGNRATGWEAPTGTATRTTFATTSVTLPLLAQRVKALIDDLTTHGLIGS